MGRLFSVLVSIMFSLTVISGCRKNDKGPPAGKGGTMNLRITPQHHGENIDSCMIYIKYNALDAPVGFDDSLACINSEGRSVALFSGLKKGNYYLFGKGWEKPFSIEVRGGIPYSIRLQDTTLDVFLPVTEFH
jgi:hypothetical protein